MVDKVKQVVGMEDKFCYVCGRTDALTRHHVIPKNFNPVKNITIPLCIDHKDFCHPVLKQLYIPNDIRARLSELNSLLNKSLGKSKSINTLLKLHKVKDNNQLVLPKNAGVR